MDLDEEADDSQHPDSYLHSLLYDMDWAGSLARISAYPAEARVLGSQRRYPLHAACDSDAPAVVISALLKAFPDASIAVGTSRMNPLHITCSSSHASVHTIRVLMELGRPGQFQQQDQDGDTPLHTACRCGATAEVLEVLVRPFPQAVSMRDHEGLTPLLRLWVRYFIVLGSNVIEGVRTQAELLEGELGQAWAKSELLLRYAYHETILSGTNDDGGRHPSFRAVHAVSAIDCPREVVRMAVTAFPQQLHQEDENGKTPLIIATEAKAYEARDLVGDGDEIEELLYAAEHDEHQDNREHSSEPNRQPSVIDILLDANREDSAALAAVAHPENDRLPLHVAISSGKRWNQGVESLVNVYHSALSFVDPVTGLLPFQLAAEGERNDVNTTFELLRSEPVLLEELRRKETRKSSSV